MRLTSSTSIRSSIIKREQEYRMFAQIVFFSIPLLLIYLCHKVYYLRKKQFSAWPQLPPSLTWGHLKGLHEFINQGENDRHIGL